WNGQARGSWNLHGHSHGRMEPLLRQADVAVVHAHMQVRLETLAVAKSRTPAGDPRVKIATFNINNINKRLQNLLAWLAEARPDVVCLQELKCEQHGFPAQALRSLGYRGV